MFNSIIKLALQYRSIVLIFIIAVIGFGIYRYEKMPIDAFPDISPIMVPVFAEAPGMAPEEIERLISYPIESAMNGLPDITLVKSTSAFGMAVVYVYFKDNVNIYFARQLVAERLNSIGGQLPSGIDKPVLGPISSGLGQVFIYYLKAEGQVDTGGKDLNVYLRELNDWVVKFQLQTVPGVTSILSMGGYVLQYQIDVDPYKSQKYNISLTEIIEAVNKNNHNVGGQYLVIGSEEYLVRGIGLLRDLDDIREIPLKEENGVPVLIQDIAKVSYGKEIRRGAVTHNGQGEIVSGLVLKLYGENTSKVIDALYKKVAEIQENLPKGIKLVPYYEQAHLVNKANETVKNALIQGIILVLLILFLFLGRVRASLLVAFSIPFCAAVAIIGMDRLGISANLMSLGGIAVALGMLVDGGIVVTDNILRHFNLPENTGLTKLEIVEKATLEVGRPIAFALTIIIAVFIPLFSLEGVEGKMFKPMAFAICLALFGSIFAAVVNVPVLASFMLKPKKESGMQLLNKFSKFVYKPLLKLAIKFRYILFLSAACGVVFSVLALMKIGKEFMPSLEEGSILVGVSMAPSISLDKAKDTVLKMERSIVKFQPVRETISRIGRPEAGSHPHPVNYAEIHIELKPLEKWEGYKSKEQLISELRHKLAFYPGVNIHFSQPIQNAFDELLSGIKAFFAIKLYGEDLEILRTKAEEIRRAVSNVEGVVDLSVEQNFGQPQVQVILDHKQAARYGISGETVMQLVETAVGGSDIDTIYKNTRRYAIHLRYDKEFRHTPEALKRIQVRAADGHTITLGQIAEIRITEGPVQINREKNHRRWIIQGNISGRALSHIVSDIKKRIKEKVKLPPGYYVELGGQFENQQRAMTRLIIIVPIVIAVIFILLSMTFKSVRHALIVMINVPLALIGGVTGLLVTDQFLSVPASVGFIALLGIAIQDAVVMVADFNQLRQEGMPLKEAIIEGSLIRFRPVVLTTLTTLFGLMPLLLSNGVGAEVQKPLATIVVWGLSSSTFLTLFLLPSFYFVIEKNKTKTCDQ
jgi:cobalt-zinc-cadmium resistance protein CzcA